MPIILAEHAGFCVGVKRAVDSALALANDASNINTYGELVHNPSVLQKLADSGILPVDSLEAVSGNSVIIRSHGVSPKVLNECVDRKLSVIDLTCPFVSRLHQKVANYSQEGKPVILIGEKNHPEVQGTVGWCKSTVYLVNSVNEAEELPPMKQALAVSQTTFPHEVWEEITNSLRKRITELQVIDTICTATVQRQKSARDIAKKADAMIVIGGKNSANTQKLYKSCKELCNRTIMVERAEDIPPCFADIKKDMIGITAGASTPEWSIKEVITRMTDIENKDQVVPTEETVVPTVEPTAPVEETTAPVAEVTAPVEEAVAPEAEVVAPVEEAEASEAEVETTPEEQAKIDFMADIDASMVKIRPGQVITGNVVQITDDEVCVNIGYKSDGLIKRSELVDKDVQVGEEIEVEVSKINDGEGNVLLSQRNIINRKVWEDLVKKYENNEVVEAIGKDVVKGGLIARIEGIRAFIPASHLAQRYVEDISEFKGQTLKLKIIELDRAKKRIVASRKLVLKEENEAKKAEIWEKLEEGTVVDGVVRRLTNFGAFVDIGGVDGLIHITDLSWGRIKHPSDVVKPNQKVKVIILSLDRERERIQLGLKQMTPHPWEIAQEKYAIGSIVEGKVVRITTFGAFVELEPGLDGLVHISQCAVTRVQKVEDAVEVGQVVRVKVLNVDSEAHRISLSIREVLADEALTDDEEIDVDDAMLDAPIDEL